MNYRIENLPELKLIGKRLKMSFANNKTPELWKNFMPRRKEIQNNTGSELYSVQIYPDLFFDNFNEETEFEKWAAIKVSGFETIPFEMEPFKLVSGLYAVFIYKGAARDGATVFDYILNTWLPASVYHLDNRPHFEILGNKYINNSADSEEEIWIPVKSNT